MTVSEHWPLDRPRWRVIAEAIAKAVLFFCLLFAGAALVFVADDLAAHLAEQQERSER